MFTLPKFSSRSPQKPRLCQLALDANKFPARIAALFKIVGINQPREVIIVSAGIFWSYERTTPVAVISHGRRVPPRLSNNSSNERIHDKEYSGPSIPPTVSAFAQ